MVHADFMTHRTHSRNASSARAIPVEKLLQKIEDDPVLPVWWGKNQKGMQAREELAREDIEKARMLWLEGRDFNVGLARRLGKVGLHKQLANRVAEPWMFIVVVLTATETDNYAALRTEGMAQPELEDVVVKTMTALKESTPQKLGRGAWHLPLVTGYDEVDLRARNFSDFDLCMVSSARCSRASYMTHEGKRDPVGDLDQAENLISNGHMSPFEHVAQAMTVEQWEEYAMAAAHEWATKRVPVGNFWGWKQFRKTLRNEHDYSKIKGAR
jgi:hypothetical protein